MSSGPLCLTCSHSCSVLKSLRSCLIRSLAELTASLCSCDYFWNICFLLFFFSSATAWSFVLSRFGLWGRVSTEERERERFFPSAGIKSVLLFTARCSASSFSLFAPGQQWEAALYLTCALSLCVSSWTEALTNHQQLNYQPVQQRDHASLCSQPGARLRSARLGSAQLVLFGLIVFYISQSHKTLNSSGGSKLPKIPNVWSQIWV